MNDEIVAVAKAICKAKGIDPDRCVFGSGSINVAGGGKMECHRRAWQEHIGQARAAIAAMPKPSADVERLRAALKGCVEMMELANVGATALRFHMAKQEGRAALNSQEASRG